MLKRRKKNNELKINRRKYYILHTKDTFYTENSLFYIFRKKKKTKLFLLPFIINNSCNRIY